MSKYIQSNLNPMPLAEALEFANHVTIDGEWYRVHSWDSESKTLYYEDPNSEEEFNTSLDELKDKEVTVHCLAQISLTD